MTIEDFHKWEKYTNDTIDVKRTYIDITGDLIAGFLLSQIIYWHLPTKDNKSRLRVRKKEGYCLAKKRTDWWAECRITAKQYDRASKILKAKGFAKIKLYKFNGSPIHHILLNLDKIVEAINELEIEIPILPEGENPIAPESKLPIDQVSISLTENTNREEIIPKVACGNLTDLPENSFEDKLENKHYKKGLEISISEVLLYFRDLNPAYRNFYADEKQLHATARLLQTLGYDYIVKLLNWVYKIRRNPEEHTFAPIITSPVEFEEKTAKLVQYLRRRAEEEKRAYDDECVFDYDLDDSNSEDEELPTDEELIEIGKLYSEKKLLL